MACIPIQTTGGTEAVCIDMPDAFGYRESVLALFGTLLYRYSGQDRIKFETSDGAIIDLDLAGDPSFTVLTESLAGEKQGERNRVVCLAPADFKHAIAPERADASSGFLVLQFERRNIRTTLEFLFSDEQFDRNIIARLAQHCARLARSAAATPDHPISRLAMMSDEELHEVLVKQNGTTVPFARTSIPDEFEERVRAAPDAVALLYQGQAVSYRDLHSSAIQVAASLQRSGVELETLVGVYLDDPPSAATAYLGIVSAAGVVVTLDPAWPRERLEQVIRSAGIRFVITSPDLAADLPAGPHILDHASLESPEHAFVRPSIAPDNVAYVVFTSGSTGVPKGVVGLHRTITCVPKVAIPLKHGEVVALSTNLAFGAGVIGLFNSLIQGAAVLLVPGHVGKDLPALVRTWQASGVTRIIAVAPQLRQLSVLGPEIGDRLKSITTVILSGAALTSDLLPSIYSLFPDAMVMNAYSCLEVGTMTSRWVSLPGNRRKQLNEGQVLPNMRVYILGPRLNPLPAGMPGEIYVGSADMSRGYLNEPELTRARFLPNPFDVPEIPRIYRTGDVGRLLPDGSLAFLGRADNQVKIRGIRIELEEIEAALYLRSDVHQAAVVAAPHGTESRLVAYVSARPGSSLVTSAVREHLESRLPTYMIPSLFVLMDQLPITRNGKIDRQELLKVGVGRPEMDTPYAAPSDEIEAAVAEIWEKELGIEGIGVEDHFLEVGGDSMLAVLISVRIKQRLGWTIPGTMLFEFPSVRALVGQLRTI